MEINALGIIQWQITPAPPTELPDEILAIGPVDEHRVSFMELLDRWFRSGSCPTASRLAVGVAAILPVETHAEGYETLGRYLSAVRIDPQRSSDFLYRINRPRDSTTNIPALRINRLSKWAVLKMNLVAGVAGASSRASIRERYACSVELDINTVPTFEGYFSPEQAQTVFHELDELAGEILVNGDVP